MFSALAEPTRRDILEMLADHGQMPASDIYKRFNVSHPAISQHLKVLREANLVSVEKQAQQRLYSINADRIDELEEWIQKLKKHWEQSFDRLEKLLEREKAKGK